MVMKLATIFIMGLLPPQKSAGPPGVSFESPQALLGAIGPRARLILTPARYPKKIFFTGIILVEVT